MVAKKRVWQMPCLSMGDDSHLLSFQYNCGPKGPVAGAKRPHVAEGHESERSETVVPTPREANIYTKDRLKLTMQIKTIHSTGSHAIFHDVELHAMFL